MRTKQVRDTLYGERQALLPGWKLVKKDEGCVRAIPGRKQKLLVSVIDYSPDFRFSRVFVTRLDAVEHIFNVLRGSARRA